MQPSFFWLAGISEGITSYGKMSLTTPAPTVRPPSRTANRTSFSNPIGAFNPTSPSPGPVTPNAAQPLLPCRHIGGDHILRQNVPADAGPPPAPPLPNRKP